MLATCERAGRIVSGARRAEGEMEARIFRAVDEVERRKNVASFFCEFLLLKKMGNLLQLTLVRRQRERRHRLSPSFSLSHTQLRSRQQPALALPRSLMRASPTRRMGSYERFQDSVRLAFFKRERLEMVFGSIGENRCSTDAFSLFLFFPLSLSLSLFCLGHRRRLGPRGLHRLRHHPRRRRRRRRLPAARNRHRRPAPRRGHHLPRLREAGGDGQAAERRPGRGVGPLDGRPAGLPARVLRLEDRVLRVEEEGGVLFRGFPSGVRGGG